MTKAHFELLAETVANDVADHTAEGTTLVDVGRVIHALADMCASTNPNFDRDRFVGACTTVNYRAPRNVTRY